MIYNFDVFLDDKDYYEYNKFHILHSPYGKKYKRTIALFYIAITLLIFIVMAVVDSLIMSLLAVLPMMLLGGLMMLIFPYIVILILKLQIALTKNSPKKNYSPKASISFGEESITEETELAKVETKYFVIERISVTEQAIYMHITPTTAYILPTSLFESDEALDEFIDFLKTKNEKIFIHTRRKLC